jgi:sigma-B regulation protein RsbU (phosphoserine phosphatase)
MTVEGTLRSHPVKVLLVDDQALIGEAVRRILADVPGVRYEYCSDPTKALAVAERFAPTVILSDLVMPQLDGLELVRRFRTHGATRQTPLIVLSSKEEAATKAEAFALGANDYLVKLPDPVELVARIRYHSDGYVHLLQRDEAYRALEASQKVLRDDLDQAARYVASLLPAPTEERIRADWRFIPSASLGGDAFGYHWHDDDHFALYLLDVSGHGVGAALLSVSALNVLRSETLPDCDFANPGQVLTRLSDKFQTRDQSGKYFTVWYGVYRPSTRELLWSGGGHPPAVLLPDPSGAGTPIELASSGPMPGIMPDLHYETRRVDVPEGSRLLLFSDGVYELHRTDQAMWTYGAFLEVAQQASKRGPGFLNEIVEKAREIRGGAPFLDDVSLVAVDFP